MIYIGWPDQAHGLASWHFFVGSQGKELEIAWTGFPGLAFISRVNKL